MSHYNVVIYCTFYYIYLFLQPPKMADKFYSKTLRNRMGNFMLSFEYILIQGSFSVQDFLLFSLHSAFEMPEKVCQGVIIMAEICYSAAGRHWTAYRESKRALSSFLFHGTHRLPSWLIIFPNSKAVLLFWCASESEFSIILMNWFYSLCHLFIGLKGSKSICRWAVLFLIT